MDYYTDATVNTSFINWATVSPFEPERRMASRPEVKNVALPTPPVVTAVTDFFAVPNGLSAPTANTLRRPSQVYSGTAAVAKAPAQVSSDGNAEAREVVERIAKQRVQLMAVKYASGDEPREMTARLAILNHRLLDHSPRVSVEQVQALEAAATQLAAARNFREERMRRLGITA